MVLRYAFPVPRWTSILGIQPVREKACPTTEQEILVDFHEFLSPKSVLVQDVARQHFGRNSAGQILDTLPDESTFNGRIVTMGFGEGLFQ